MTPGNALVSQIIEQKNKSWISKGKFPLNSKFIEAHKKVNLNLIDCAKGIENFLYYSLHKNGV